MVAGIREAGSRRATERLRKVAFDYATLDELLDRVYRRIGPIPRVNALGMDEVAGRILAHVDDSDGKAAVVDELEHVVLPKGSGGTVGRVDLACMDTQSSSSPGLFNLCQTHAVVTLYDGDSGGPVFVKAGSQFTPNPRAAGVASIGGFHSLWFSPAGAVVGTLGLKYFLAW